MSHPLQGLLQYYEQGSALERMKCLQVLADSN